MASQTIEGFRISPPQRLLWELCETGEGYVSSCAIAVRGEIQPDMLQETLRHIVNANSVFRTSFYQAGRRESPLQVISDDASIDWNDIDFSSFSADRKQDKLSELLKAERAHGFQFASGALMRASLVRIQSDHHVLVLTLPALCADSVTLDCLLRMIADSYSALVNDKTPEFNPTQYLQISEWLNELMEGRDGQAEEQAGSRVFALPGQVQPQDGVPFAVAVTEFPIDASAFLKIESWAERASVSPQAVWMALWQTVLWKLTGEARFVLGFGCAGRKYEELQNVPGPCFRTLPVNTALHADYRFAEVVALASNEISNAESEQEYFSLHPMAGGEDPFTACFEWQKWPKTETRDGVSFSMHSRFSCSNRFLVNAVVVRKEGAGSLELHYDENCIPVEAVNALGGQLLALTESALENPQSKIGQFSILGPGDRHRMLVEWNQTGENCDYETPVQELIAKAASQAKHEIAVECGSQAVTFAELDRRSNQLARHLRAEGVVPDEPVAILMGRSIELLVAVLGILKAGGAYLPLAPSDPRERIAFILNDASARIVLTNGTRDEIHGVTTKIINLDREFVAIGSHKDDALGQVTLPENLAYIIYTSGSTGVPKGVLVTHAGLLNYLHWAGKYYKVAGGNGAALHSDINFDMTVTSLFAPLIAGKRVLIVPEAKDTSGLPNLLRSRDNFSFIKLTPSHLDVFSSQLQGEDIAQATHALIVGGEALMAESVSLWRSQSPQTRIINEYGPTETVVGCCIYEVVDNLPGRGPVPIGRPIANTQLYILDESLEPAPVGVLGELYIGGAGLARGYLNRSDLTAERFTPNPFSPIPGERIYRTGDLARYRYDGTIEYAGRIDSQVKIHGHRVECGEVEAALRQHREIRDAGIIAWGRSTLEKQLIAYVVVNTKPGPSSRELRQFLLERLPEYMVPARYIVVDRMPLTASGKIDRKALPEPGPLNAPSTDVPYAPPQTLAQEVLASIWSEVLGFEQVGIDDNFFVLGGDSIRAIQVRARSQKRGLRITQQQLFERQTIRELAQVASFAEGEAGQDTLTEPFSLISEEDRRKLHADIEDAYPLTHLQKGMLFHAELNPESAVYHDLHSFHLRIPFDEETLRTAIQDLVTQHAVLRTSFDLTRYGQPLQLVHRHVEMNVEVTDLRHLSGERLQEALADAVEKQKERRFLWHNAPLVRFAVQRRTDETIQFVMCFQHSIMDGWSAATLLTSLFNRYSALLRGHSEPLPKLASAFRDFVAAESKALASPEHRSFWEEMVNGTAPVKLPRSRSGVQPSERRAHIFPVPISEELSMELQKLARSASVPVKSVLLAAHLKVMNLLAGRNDVTTGVVLSGRLAETDGDRVLGLFLNVMPLRLNLQGGSWQQLITETFEAERAMLPFRRYPLAELQHVRGDRELFETACNFMHYHVYRNVERLSDAQLLDYTGYEETNFAFIANFSVEPASPRIHLQFNYLPSEFSQEHIERIGDYYLRALQAMASGPEESYANIDLLSEAERQWLVGHAEGHRPADASLESIAACFEDHARRTPQAVALEYEGQQWTYQQLDQESNQLAHYLRNLGVGSETIVGVSMERSAALVKSLLAILKAGGAYLPLDADFPADRLDYLIKDTGTMVVLVGENERKKLHALGVLDWIQVVDVDSEREAIDKESIEQLPLVATRDNLAYVMYTSGSTGHPKGVAITHGNVLRLVHQAQFANLDGQRFIQFAPASFDASTLEIWGSLLNGAHLAVFSGALSTFSELGAFLREHEITTLWLTAGLFHKIVEEELHVLAPVRQLLAGGDVLSPAAVKTVLDLLPECQVINGYGPTEATTFACCFNARSADWDASVPIGKPINLTQIYILDQHMQRVPVGVAGGLYIGGDGLGRGYLRRPDLTAERFVPHPFSQRPGERLYHSGDLAKYRDDGNLEFCGRADRQIKIRGFRIELAEIEAALLRQPGIIGAAVAVHEKDGEKEIIAYFVLDEGVQFTTLQLREELKTHLPEFMIPARFTKLEKLPLTINGKVDRAKLPPPDVDDIRQEQEYVAPQTDAEKVLAELWAEVLEVERVGVHDNFFVLGGHSLVATQLVSRIRGRFGIDLPLGDLFEFSEIATLARRVEQAIAAKHTAPEIIPISRAKGDQISSRPTKDIDSLFSELEQLSDETAQQMLQAPIHAAEIFPLSYSQEQIWNREQKRPGKFNLPLSVQLKGKLHVPALERSLNEITRRQAALRTTIVPSAGTVGQTITESLRLSNIPVVDLSGYAPEEADRIAKGLIREEAQALFDLQAGPLFRAKLLRFNEENHIVLFTLHLIISDAWSLNVLMKELSAIYPAFEKGLSSPLEELPVQLVDYAHWETRREFAQEIKYWSEQLGGDFEAVELPLARPRHTAVSGQGGRVSRMITGDTVERIRGFCQQNEITLFMFAVAVFKMLLREYAGQQDITIGIPESGRNRREIEGLIGSFANTLALRTQVTPGLSFTQLVQSVRKVMLEAYEHRDMPFSKLLSMLGRGMPSEENPLFRMMIDLVVANSDPKMSQLSELEVKALNAEPESLVMGNDLTAMIKDQGRDLEAAFLYKTALFDDAFMEQMLDRFNVLVHKVLDRPECPILEH